VKVVPRRSRRTHPDEAGADGFTGAKAGHKATLAPPPPPDGALVPGMTLAVLWAVAVLPNLSVSVTVMAVSQTNAGLSSATSDLLPFSLNLLNLP
jgi:hypothetical protein